MTADFIVAEKLLKNVIENFQSDPKAVLDWVGSNQRIANPGKFQYMLLGKHKSLKIEIKGIKLGTAKSVKLLGLTIDHNLTFDTHASNICKTASAHMKNLTRIRNSSDEKHKITVKLFHFFLV